MKDVKISESVIYIGADDKTLDLFESQYVIPNGVSYNSYVILDDKVAVMDTADSRVTEQWFANLEAALNGKHSETCREISRNEDRRQRKDLPDDEAVLYH